MPKPQDKYGILLPRGSIISPPTPDLPRFPLEVPLKKSLCEFWSFIQISMSLEKSLIAQWSLCKGLNTLYFLWSEGWIPLSQGALSILRYFPKCDSIPWAIRLLSIMYLAWIATLCAWTCFCWKINEFLASHVFHIINLGKIFQAFLKTWLLVSFITLCWVQFKNISFQFSGGTKL